MKRTICIVIATTILMTACQKNKQDIVKDFLSSTNSFDKAKIEQLLADNFVYVQSNGIKQDKAAFLNRIDSLKNYGNNSNIISAQVFDSVIKTEERATTMIDSLLDVTPKIVQHKTYNVKDGKIVSVQLDTTLNWGEYNKSFREKIIPFLFWVEDTHGLKGEQEIFKDLKKHLTEYSQVSVFDKKKYRTYANLQGSYVSKNNSFYRKLIFKGKTTVVIVDAIFGMSFPSSYVLDEKYIRIRTDKSDLFLEIKDNNTLVGEGWAAGTFKRQ